MAIGRRSDAYGGLWRVAGVRRPRPVQVPGLRGPLVVRRGRTVPPGHQYGLGEDVMVGWRAVLGGLVALGCFIGGTGTTAGGSRARGPASASPAASAASRSSRFATGAPVPPREGSTPNMIPSAGRVLLRQPSHLPPLLPPRDFPTTLPTLPPAFHGPACPGDQLRVSVWANGGGLGHVDLVLALQNESPRPCQLVGWPTVDGVTVAGAPTPVPHEPNLALGVNVTGVPVQTP